MRTGRVTRIENNTAENGSRDRPAANTRARAVVLRLRVHLHGWYHRDQRIRFEPGMSCPWLSVSPDPGSLGEDESSDTIRTREKEYREQR